MIWEGTQKASAALEPAVGFLCLGDTASFKNALAAVAWKRPALTVLVMAVVANIPPTPDPVVETHLEQSFKVLLAAGARWHPHPFLGRWLAALKGLRPDLAGVYPAHPLPWLLQSRPAGSLRTHVVGRLLHWGHSPREPASQGWSLLDLAAAQGDSSVARLLLWAGAPCDARALAVATTGDMVDLLLDSGATTTVFLPALTPRLDGAPAVVWLSARPETAPALRRVLQRAGNTAMAAAFERIQARANTDHHEWAMSPWAMVVRAHNREGGVVLAEEGIPWNGPQDGAGNSLCHLLFRPLPTVSITRDAVEATWQWFEPLVVSQPASAWALRNARGEAWRDFAARAIQESIPGHREPLRWLFSRMDSLLP